ncbi:MAG: ABC transporter ATP-binding protein [Acidobacteria bacterium]|nr:ABC transporter ATP-binding protein [Acidobacteriota bacterium]|tara:strand:- start:469 stop:1245 length:777 start_codon:yes stop_codon:yes gene_type:complete
MALLTVENLEKRFGGLIAVNDISFEVESGEIFTIIGPNGAGKSTLFKLITSFTHPTSGRVIFEGEDITRLPAHVVARKGVVRTFQETTIFKEMTVVENVIVAHHLRSRASSLGIFVNSPKARRDEERFRESANSIIEILGLDAVRNEQARNLPHGYLRELGIAIAMAAEPKALLLDEPFSGMNPEETDRVVDMVRGIRDRGITILLVEHDMRAVMRISDRILVLNFGSMVALGTPPEIQNNESVIEAYLGREDDELGI